MRAVFLAGKAVDARVEGPSNRSHVSRRHPVCSMAVLRSFYMQSRSCGVSVASVVVVHAHLRYIYLVRESASSNPPGVIARNEFTEHGFGFGLKVKPAPRL